MGSPPGVAGVFDRAADTYDAVGVPWFRPIAEGLVAGLAPQPGERVLDIGCGRGAALEPLARAVGSSGHALGIDLAPRMVELTGRDLADLPQVAVRVGDAANPGLPEGSFDLIASSLVLFFLHDPAVAVKTWVPMLVDGGRLGVATFGAQDERWARLDKLFVPYLPPKMLDARTSGSRGPFASDEGMTELFSDAGLTDVGTAHRTVEAAFRDAEHLLEFSWSHGQRAMWEAVPKAEHEQLRQQIATAVGAGPIRFSQQVRYTTGRRG